MEIEEEKAPIRRFVHSTGYGRVFNCTLEALALYNHDDTFNDTKFLGQFAFDKTLDFVEHLLVHPGCKVIFIGCPAEDLDKALPLLEISLETLIKAPNPDRKPVLRWGKRLGHQILVIQIPGGKGYTLTYANSFKWVLEILELSNNIEAWWVPEHFQNNELFRSCHDLDEPKFRDLVSNVYVAVGTHLGEFTKQLRYYSPKQEVTSEFWTGLLFRHESGEHICILTWKRSFWGDVAEALGKALIFHEAKEIWHVGCKVGSLQLPNDAQSLDFFNPTTFEFLAGGNEQKLRGQRFRNVRPLARRELHHVSGGNIFDQTTSNLQLAIANSAPSTIDCEGAHFARAAIKSIPALTTSSGTRQMQFGLQKSCFRALYFASDYVCRHDQERLENAPGLGGEPNPLRMEYLRRLVAFYLGGHVATLWKPDIKQQPQTHSLAECCIIFDKEEDMTGYEYQSLSGIGLEFTAWGQVIKESPPTQCSLVRVARFDPFCVNAKLNELFGQGYSFEVSLSFVVTFKWKNPKVSELMLMKNLYAKGPYGPVEDGLFSIQYQPDLQIEKEQLARILDGFQNDLRVVNASLSHLAPQRIQQYVVDILMADDISSTLADASLNEYETLVGCFSVARLTRWFNKRNLHIIHSTEQSADECKRLLENATNGTYKREHRLFAKFVGLVKSVQRSRSNVCSHEIQEHQNQDGSIQDRCIHCNQFKGPPRHRRRGDAQTNVGLD